MANWNKAIRIDEIDLLVRFLRHIMGDRSQRLHSTHYLSPMFQAYDSWSIGGKPNPVPNEVIILATYAQALRSFRSDFSDHRIQQVVSKRLCAENHVLGLLFEFRSCIHFDKHHRVVRWLPNVGQLSESDLRVHHFNGSIFYVECTSREPKPHRVGCNRVIMADVLNALRKKSRTNPNLNHPRVVSVFFLENLDFKDDELRQELGLKLQSRWASPRYGSVSALMAISNTPPKVGRRTKTGIYYDTDLLSLSYLNPQADQALPAGSINPEGM